MAAELVTIQGQIGTIQNQIGTIDGNIAAFRQELLGVTNMSIPTFVRTIEAKIQQREAFVSTIGNLDQELAIKANLIEERLKEQSGSHGGWKNKPILECKSIENLKAVIDGKGYRIWNRKFRNLPTNLQIEILSMRS